MKKANYIFLLAIVVCFLTADAFAQINTDTRRVIEVTGSAEMLIMPNEFTFKITLNERIENKQKLTIGENIGQAVFVKEMPDDDSDERSNFRSNSNISSNVFIQDGQSSAAGLSFSKIKIRFSVLARFEIN